MTITWREDGNDAFGQIRPRIRYTQVFANGNPGTEVYAYGTICTDLHTDATWETCTSNFNLGNFQVQDIRLYIYNNTDGTIHVDHVKAVDG